MRPVRNTLAVLFCLVSFLRRYRSSRIRPHVSNCFPLWSLFFTVLSSLVLSVCLRIGLSVNRPRFFCSLAFGFSGGDRAALGTAHPGVGGDQGPP